MCFWDAKEKLDGWTFEMNIANVNKEKRNYLKMFPLKNTNIGLRNFEWSLFIYSLTISLRMNRLEADSFLIRKPPGRWVRSHSWGYTHFNIPVVFTFAQIRDFENVPTDLWMPRCLYRHSGPLSDCACAHANDSRHDNQGLPRIPLILRRFFLCKFYNSWICSFRIVQL